MDILTAKVALVQIGSKIQVEGLQLDDGRFGLSVVQVNELLEFSASNKVASRNIKRILGKAFKASKVKVKGAKQAFNCILLADFQSLLFELAIRGNQKAIALSRVLIGLSLEQLFADAFGLNWGAGDRQKVLDRILDTADPWKRLYTKEACDKAFKWFGTDFYWRWCYNFLTLEEQCKLNKVNPIDKYGDRKFRIHQHLEPATRKRLEPKITRLVDFLVSSTSAQDFRTRIARAEGFNQRDFF